LVNVGQGSLLWGCGECGSVDGWYDEMGHDFKMECIGQKKCMIEVVNQPVCIKTSEGLWNVRFKEYSIGVGGQFMYVRTPYVE
jgi:hypothetical protein